MPGRGKLILTIAALGIILSYAPFIQSLEGDAYDARMSLYLELSYRSIPLHPAIRLVGLDRGPRSWRPGDAQKLAANLAQNRPKAVAFLHGYTVKSLSPSLKKALAAVPGLIQGQEVLGPDAGPPISQVVGAEVASLDVFTDSDGTVRRVPLVVREPGRDRWIPSTALLAYARLCGVQPGELGYEPGGIRVGERFLPTGPGYELYVRYRDPQRLEGSWNSVDWQEYGHYTEQLRPASLWNLLDPGSAYFQFVPGRAVLISEYDYVGEDQILTPLGRMRGLQLQACVLDTLLSGWTLRPFPMVWTHLNLCLFVLALTWVCSTLRPLASMALWGGVNLALALINFWLFTRGWLLPLYQPAIASLFGLFGLLVWREYEARKSLRKFGGQMAIDTVRALDDAGLRLAESREKVASIVFCNIPEYLKVLERGGSLDYFHRRREFSRLLSEICRTHRGLVLDYQGDAQMMGFGVEFRTDDPDHAYRAVRAAFKLAELERDLAELWWMVDDPDLIEIRCGVATGLVAVGTVGASSKKAQAAIGDTTNLAARLLGAALKQRIEVLVNEAARQACGTRLHFVEVPPVRLKGKSQPVVVFEAREEA